jgi:hypothetical protein
MSAIPFDEINRIALAQAASLDRIGFPTENGSSVSGGLDRSAVKLDNHSLSISIQASGANSMAWASVAVI